MTGEVIKSFLVGLGFGVDEKSLAAFNKSIAGAAIKVTALYASIKIAAAGIFASIASVSQGFEDMGYQLRIVAPAVNRWLIMRQAMINAYSKAGVNISQVVKQAILFDYALAKMKFTFQALFGGVAAKFFPILTKQMDIFRYKIYANMPKIQASLTKFVEFIFKAFKATNELGYRLWEILTRIWSFFVRLDESTHGWSTVILGLVAAWQLLNLSFLATPFGMIIAGITALILLWDDFKIWQEGGKSLFNWASFVPVINAVGESIKFVKDVLGDLFTILFDVIGLYGDLLTLDFAHFKEDMKNMFGDIGKYISDLVSEWKSLVNVGGTVINWGASVAGWAANHLGLGGGQSPNLSNVGPLLPSQNGVNQNVHQQTQINVNGAADANNVGKAVAGHQDRVNFDMTRNMKGAVQ